MSANASAAEALNGSAVLSLSAPERETLSFFTSPPEALLADGAHAVACHCRLASSVSLMLLLVLCVSHSQDEKLRSEAKREKEKVKE